VATPVCGPSWKAEDSIVSDGRMSRQLAVGVTVLIALVILAISILAIGNASRMFTAKAHYRTEFTDVLGLRAGSPVYLSGVQVGGVEEIELPVDPQATKIPVLIAIDRKVAPRIRAGTTATLTFLQLLSGDKLIILDPGSADLPLLEEGGLIPPTEGASLFEAGTSAAANLAEITTKLNAILDPIQRSVEEKKGLVGRLVADDDFGKEGLDNLNGSLKELRTLINNLNAGRGVAGRLLADQEYATVVTGALVSSLRRIDTLLSRIEAGEGGLGALAQPGGRGEALVTELHDAVADLHAMTTAISSGKGLAHVLIYDEAFANEMKSNMLKSSASLASILEKIDRGEGTAGALLNDPAVYDGLREIITGVKGSKLGSGMLHHYQKKGEKIEAEGAAAPPPPASKTP